MDWISSLSDDILCHTLSFLSTKAKRWRNLFAFSQNLRFHEQDFVYQDSDSDISQSFINFLERVLAVSGNFSLKKFSLKCRKNIESARINRWIRNVLSRGVLDLLHLDIVTKSVYSLPFEVFTGETLVKLNLGRGFVIAMVPENASLPALKTLFLDRVRFYDHQNCAFETVLSACRVLEELTIVGDRWEHWKWCSTVSCHTLQRLTIDCEVSYDFYGFVGSDSRSITLDTPSLVYFEYSGFVPDVYPIVNLDSLVEAKLTLATRKRSCKSNPTNLIKGLRNVEILNILSLETSKIFYAFRDAIPLFENLSCLYIATTISSGLCWKLLPLMLKKVPILKTFVIEGPLYGYPFLLPCSLKVLEITKYTGTKEELKQMKYLLTNSPCLELVKICAWSVRPSSVKLPRQSECLDPTKSKTRLGQRQPLKPIQNTMQEDKIISSQTTTSTLLGDKDCTNSSSRTNNAHTLSLSNPYTVLANTPVDL